MMNQEPKIPNPEKIAQTIKKARLACHQCFFFASQLFFIFTQGLGKVSATDAPQQCHTGVHQRGVLHSQPHRHRVPRKVL